MKLILVRHGQTDWNLEMKLTGRVDVELNQVGREQCQELVQKLDSDFGVLFSSPLKRALETAEVIAEHFQKDVIIKDELAEWDYGTLAGLTWAEVEERTGIDIRAITREEKYDFRPYGGESAEHVQARVLTFVEEAKAQPCEKVVVACHSGIISTMQYLFPGSHDTSALSNTSVHEFEV